MALICCNPYGSRISCHLGVYRVVTITPCPKLLGDEWATSPRAAYRLGSSENRDGLSTGRGNIFDALGGRTVDGTQLLRVGVRFLRRSWLTLCDGQ